jgi:hypothetical protein
VHLDSAQAHSSPMGHPWELSYGLQQDWRWKVFLSLDALVATTHWLLVCSTVHNVTKISRQNVLLSWARQATTWPMGYNVCPL